MRRLLLALTIAFAPAVLSAQGTAPSTAELGTHGNNGDAADTGHSDIALTSSIYTLSPNEWWQEHINVSCATTITAGEIVAPLNNGKHYIVEVPTTCGHTVIVCGAPVVGTGLGTPSGACTDAIPDDGKMYWIATDGTKYGLTSGSSGSGGSVTSFAAPSGSWPSWLVPTVANATTTPSLSVALSSVGSYTVLGNCTGSSAMPSFCPLNASMIPSLSSLYAPLTNPGGGQNNYAPIANPNFEGTGNFTGGVQSSYVETYGLFSAGSLGLGAGGAYLGDLYPDGGLSLSASLADPGAYSLQVDGTISVGNGFFYISDEAGTGSGRGNILQSYGTMQFTSELGDDMYFDHGLRIGDGSGSSPGNGSLAVQSNISAATLSTLGGFTVDNSGNINTSGSAAIYGSLVTGLNTLDDGVGNATFQGTLYTNHNVLDDGSGNAEIQNNLYASTINTSNNTLDDGAGNATFFGTVHSTGGMSSGYNTFDDGAGNASFYGDVTGPNIVNEVNGIAPTSGSITIIPTCGGSNCPNGNNVSVPWTTSGQVALASDLSSTATSVTFVSTTGFPTQGGCIELQETSGGLEDICYDKGAISGATISPITRGNYATTPTTFTVASGANGTGYLSISAKNYATEKSCWQLVGSPDLRCQVVDAGVGSFTGLYTGTFSLGLLTPSSSTFPCNHGQFAFDNAYFYGCYSDNHWMRVAGTSIGW